MPSASFHTLIGKPFSELAEVESTNNYAMTLAKTGTAGHGAAWFAHYQTSGKGQRGKIWSSEKGQNIILSVLLDMKWLPVSAKFALSAATALAVNDFLEHYASGEIKIKWLNDIYWRDRKAAGILIENIIQGNIWQWAVVGIGININQTKFDAAIPNPVSLKQITGKDFDVVALAKELCSFLQQRFSQLKNREENILLKKYNDALYKKNQKSKLKSKNVVFDCVIKEVNEYGQLVVEGADKNIFDFGEVEWMIQ